MQRSFRFVTKITLASLFIPAVVSAACSREGYTVVFVNGIFNTKEQAQDSAKELAKYLGTSFNSEPVFVRTGYNPSHVAGLGDLVQVAAQSFGSSVSSFDRDTILMQIHPEVMTRKILLVGHSQGSLYTNDMYNYLTTKGEEPKASVGVYNVATPANYVAGGGIYLTSEYDAVIDVYAQYAKEVGALPPLPPNSPLEFGSAKGNGHSFTENYLAYGGERMVKDIQTSLARLKESTSAAPEGCFVPPENTLGYKTKQVFFAVADPTATGIKIAGVTGVKIAGAVMNGVGSGIAAVGSLFTSATKLVTPEPRTTNLADSHTLVSALYGSSVSESELDDLLGRNQGGAVALATPPTPKQVSNTQPQGEVKGVEIEQPPEPFIPQPKGIALVSPGFGGGGGSAAAPATSEITVAATTSAATTSVPAATSTPVVPDGTEPAVVSLQVNGIPLSSTPLPVTLTPVATTSPVWVGVITFTEDIASPPLLKDGTPFFNFTNGSPQVVHDCADANAKTFCFTYALLSGIEAAVFWYFEVSGARDISGEVMATSTFRFILDTKGPTLTPDWLYTNTATPTVTGSASFVSAKVELLLNAVSYSFYAANTAWAFAVQPADQLTEGVYSVVASSTDQNGNVEVTSWTLTVDLAPPVLAIQSGPGEGDSVASTSPVSFEFLATDISPIAYSCAIDLGVASVCVSPFVSTLAPGTHSFVLTASDVVGHSTTTTRNFSVLP